MLADQQPKNQKIQTPPSELSKQIREAEKKIATAHIPHKASTLSPAGEGEARTGPEPSQSIAPPAPIGPSPLLPLCEMLVSMPFNIAAAKTKCADVQLSPEESRNLAIGLDQLAGYYLPAGNADPKILALVNFTGSLLAIAYVKYMAYEASTKKPPQKPAEKPGEENPPVENSGPQIFPSLSR